MPRKPMILLVFCVLMIAGPILNAQPTPKKQESSEDLIARATQNINRKQLYDLSYKLKKGTEIRWIVEQVAETTVSMGGDKEESTSRSKTRKLWKVAGVDARGNMTFVYSIEAIDMWQRFDDSDPVQYNSEDVNENEIPDLYKMIAERVGRPHAIFTISPYGKILDRHSNFKEDKFGVGKVTIPLPGKAVPIGYKWDIPTILEANDENNRNRKLKARVLYELVKVVGKKAYIKFRTEILTPFTSEKIKSTIMQQMTDGYIVFDLERGHHILKRVEWDEKAQGFEGADSLLKYVGRLTEKLIIDGAQAESAASLLAPLKRKAVAENVELKTRESAPVLRK